MKFSKLGTLLLLFVLTVVLQSCGDDEMKEGDPCSIDFDQEALFINFADNIIIPTFEKLQSNVNTLSTHTSAFYGCSFDCDIGNGQDFFCYSLYNLARSFSF